MITSTILNSSGNLTVYTSSGQNAITTIIACNVGTFDPLDETADSADLTLYLVSYGSTASTTNMIVNSLTIPAGETVFFSEERVVLGDGDFIVAQASASNKLNITVSTLSV